MEEVNVEKFAVKLTISHPKPPLSTFIGEVERYFEQLQDMREFDVKLSEIIDSTYRITFIRGIAGMGKSVLVKLLAYKWANDELFTNFKVCITFECRELNYFALHEGRKFEEHEVLNEFIASRFNVHVREPKYVLFIIDGLDELYDISKNDSIISQLLDLKKSKYSESKLIITGRPHIEDRLFKHGGKRMGGLRKLDIIGFNDEQINEYIEKFAFSDDDVARIRKAKDSSKSNLQLLHIPQFLNSFCCVAILSHGQDVRNEAEMYSWTFYLLLKQHADKNATSDKRIPEIFNEYSEDLLVLSKVVHELLHRNAIIFEGNTDLHFAGIGKGKRFLEGAIC